MLFCLFFDILNSKQEKLLSLYKDETRFALAMHCAVYKQFL